MAALNIPNISIGNLEDRLVKYYTKAITGFHSDCDYKKIKSVMFWGPCGIGKSTSVHSISQKLEQQLSILLRKKIKVEVREIRLANCSIIELLGVPSANKDKTSTIWLEPDFFAEPEDPNTIILYFFDELDKAAAAVQAAALQLILDRQSFVHSFPKKSLVIAAGNPEQIDESVQSRFRPELNNRFRHYYLEAEFASWKRWAKENHVHPYVYEYLSYDPSKLFCLSQDDSEETAFPTPRSWASVSEYLNLMLDDETTLEELYVDISGDIGMGDAREFINWVNIHGSLPSVGAILDGKERAYPKTQDQLFSLIQALLSCMEDKKDVLTMQELKNIVAYASRFQPDFAKLFFHSAEEIPGLKLKMALVPGYIEWKKKR